LDWLDFLRVFRFYKTKYVRILFIKNLFAWFPGGLLTLTADIASGADSKQRVVSVKKEDNTPMQLWKIEIVDFHDEL